MTKHSKRRYIPRPCQRVECPRGELCQSFSPIPKENSIPYPSCNYWDRIKETNAA